MPKAVFVMGPPGSGKGTQCKRIAETFNYDHISGGELLRAEMNKDDSEHAEIIKKCMFASVNIPAKISCSLLEKEMRNSNKTKFLLDNFPYNQENLDVWNRSMRQRIELEFVIFFDCPEDVCTTRCLERGVTSGRFDDNKEILRKRFVNYHNFSKPVIEYLEQVSRLHRIDATKSPDVVFEEVCKIFKQYA